MEKSALEQVRKPINRLLRSNNRSIVVRLKNNIEYKGNMIHCDNYMNLILDNAMEYHNHKPAMSYGNIFIRGNNILFICLEPDKVDYLQ